MDQISFATVAKVFQDLIAEQFPDKILQEITDEYKQIDQWFVEKLQYAFAEKSETEKGTVFENCYVLVNSIE